MSKLNNEILETMVMECEDFLRIVNDRMNELTNEDLQIMLEDLKRVAQTNEKKIRYELNH